MKIVLRYFMIVGLSSAPLYGAHAKRSPLKKFVAWFTGEMAEEKERARDLERLQEILKLLESSDLDLQGSPLEKKQNPKTFIEAREKLYRVRDSIFDLTLRQQLQDNNPLENYSTTGDETGKDNFRVFLNAAIRERQPVIEPEPKPEHKQEPKPVIPATVAAAVLLSTPELAQQKTTEAGGSDTLGLKAVIGHMAQESRKKARAAEQQKIAQEAEKKQSPPIPIPTPPPIPVPPVPTPIPAPEPAPEILPVSEEGSVVEESVDASESAASDYSPARRGRGSSGARKKGGRKGGGSRKRKNSRKKRKSVRRK